MLSICSENRVAFLQHRSTVPGHPSLKRQPRCFVGCRTACQLPRLLCLCLAHLRSVQGKSHIARHQKHPIYETTQIRNPSHIGKKYKFNWAFMETHTKAQCFAKLRCHTGYLPFRETSWKCSKISLSANKHLPLIQTPRNDYKLYKLQLNYGMFTFHWQCKVKTLIATAATACL